MTERVEPKSKTREEVELALKVIGLVTVISPLFSVLYYYGFFFRLTENFGQVFEYHLTSLDYVKTAMTMWSPLKLIFILALPLFCIKFMKNKPVSGKERKTTIRFLGIVGVLSLLAAGVFFVFSQILCSVLFFFASFMFIWLWGIDAAYEHTPVYDFSSDKPRTFFTLAPVLFPLYVFFGALDADNSIQADYYYRITTKDSQYMMANVYRTFADWILVYENSSGQTRISWISADRVALISPAQM